jgi:hypothetical protein
MKDDLMTSSYENRYLKPIPTQSPPSIGDEVGFPPSLPDLLMAMGKMAGCAFYFSRTLEKTLPEQQFFPIRGKGDEPYGYLVVEYSSEGTSSLSEEEIEPVVETLSEFLTENFRWQQSVKEQEAQIASNITLSQRVPNDRQLSIRLQSILKAGAKFIGCHAAGCYLLDEPTTHLKLRSSWGLPSGQLIDPPRPLEGAMADLEAMLGHVVVLEDDTLIEHWNPPECFPSSVCIPISTSTTILGTLWFFCNQSRDFTDQETNLIEIIAGRIAVELERESLMRSAWSNQQFRKGVDKADDFIKRQLPVFAPEIAGWTMVGQANHSCSTIAGSFYDWLTLPNGQIAFAVGNAGKAADFQNALITTSMRTAWRSHAFYENQATRLMERVNETLWTSFLGEAAAQICMGTLELGNPTVVFTSSGNNRIVRLGEKLTSLDIPFPALGTTLTSKFHSQECELMPGERLLFLTTEEKESSAEDHWERLWQELHKILQHNHPTEEHEFCAAINTLLEEFSQQNGVGNAWILVKREK